MAWNIELSPFRSLESEIFDLVADEIMAEESDAFMHDLIHHLHYVGIGEKERLIESNCQYLSSLNDYWVTTSTHYLYLFIITTILNEVK